MNIKKETVAGVELSHPDKIYYPDVKVTKRDLAEYYHQNIKWILPHIINRPIAIVRCPEGMTKECFYQKHVETLPDVLGSVKVQEENVMREHIVVKNEAGIIALVQSGALEIHTWGCRADDIEKPDRIIFDLDPSENVKFSKIIECAQVLRTGLESLNLKSFIKTSGKKGLHVCVPLKRTCTWKQVGDFAQGLAEHMATIAPEIYTTTIAKAKRTNKILIDYLRNKIMATCVAAFSTRTTPEASLSVTLHWDELKNLKSAHEFTVLNIDRRLNKIKNDPWEEYFKVKQTLPKKFFDKK